jgi:hypothetical protein
LTIAGKLNCNLVESTVSDRDARLMLFTAELAGNEPVI